MMGFSGASEACNSARFGEGSGDIVLDNLECDGTEDTIAECLHDGHNRSNCEHHEDAGVVCIP